MLVGRRWIVVCDMLVRRRWIGVCDVLVGRRSIVVLDLRLLRFSIAFATYLLGDVSLWMVISLSLDVLLCDS